MDSSGWKLLSEFYTPPLQGQHYVGYIDSSGNLHDGETVPSDAAAVLWYRNDYTGKPEDDPRCESAVIAIAKRVVQTLTERWRITVKAPDSIAALGEMKKQGQTASIDAQAVRSTPPPGQTRPPCCRKWAPPRSTSPVWPMPPERRPIWPSRHWPPLPGARYWNPTA
ncbi:hypothetical protein [Paludibacterium denitrificans]|uniref:hypothetical protein n=1 Tax=Paludibacterium denitrificans TaxID=2675226 RepID=UPI001E417A1B|nr:hypothetical protein [Paludibacterium denitrificans]